MSKQEEQFPYMKVFLVLVSILIVVGIVTSYYNQTNFAVENNYIDNAECGSLKIYIDAGREGKDLFAHWTHESQETVNFRITPDNVDRAQLKYQWECNEKD